MSLEEEAWKMGGGPQSPPSRRPATAWDRVARLAALVILFVFTVVSVWVFSRLVPDGAAEAVSILLIAGSLLLIVWLVFQARDLRGQLDAARKELAAERESHGPVGSAPSPTETTTPPPSP